jgi:C4-dicarboxylate-specific signal transduction histidine kinase
VLAANLNARYGLAMDEDYRALVTLVKGLEKVASLNLPETDEPQMEATDLGMALDDLRIIIESDWTEMDGVIHWPQGSMPSVWADPHGLLQVFLNLAQNSLRAVRDSERRALAISVLTDEKKASVCFVDSGSGVAAPDRLFRPFDPMSEGSGLGLYISRSMARTYGGDLRFESCETGARFIVELQVV